MKTKYLEDYVEELAGFFPQIEEEELRRMITGMSDNIVKFLRRGQKGIRVSSNDSLGREEGSTKRPVFYIERIFGKKHLNSVKKGVRIRNKKRDKLYGKE